MRFFVLRFRRPSRLNAHLFEAGKFFFWNFHGIRELSQRKLYKTAGQRAHSTTANAHHSMPRQTSPPRERRRPASTHRALMLGVVAAAVQAADAFFLASNPIMPLLRVGHHRHMPHALYPLHDDYDDGFASLLSPRNMLKTIQDLEHETDRIFSGILESSRMQPPAPAPARRDACHRAECARRRRDRWR